MEEDGHMTTTTYAAQLRPGVARFAGAPVRSGNGNRTAFTGGDLPSRGIAGAGEQGVGIRVFATGGDV
jgi:hypothetical protein